MSVNRSGTKVSSSEILRRSAFSPMKFGLFSDQALRRLGRDTELVIYPGQSHGIRRPTFQRDRYERYLDWYDRYVK